MWLAVGKSSKILVKYCRGDKTWLQKSTKVPNNGNFEIFVGGVFKVHSGAWFEKYGLIKNFFYIYEGR